MEISLLDTDRGHFETLEKKQALIRDRVRGVTSHLSTGFYLWGQGGTSKSFTVTDELKLQHADYILHNSRMSGRGLVNTLEDHPTTIHVIDDCESIFTDRAAWGVLRSALWSQSRKRPMEREVSWTAHRTDIRFTFTGGIILIANRPLETVPELAALETRIASLHFVATFPEVAALMRSVALEGFEYGDDAMTPEECMTVADHIILETRALSNDLDMRVYINGVKDYLQWKTGHSNSDWQSLLSTRLRKSTETHEGRSDIVHRERVLALEISRMKGSQAEKLATWKQRTGKSDRAYWRRLKDSGRG
jgi:hypothetical protein